MKKLKLIAKPKNPWVDWFYSRHLIGTYDFSATGFSASSRKVGVFNDFVTVTFCLVIS